MHQNRLPLEPVTKEEIDAIFGQESRNTTTESPQADRGSATGTTAESSGSSTATAEAAPEDGFSLASYAASDLQRQAQEARGKQQWVE